MKAAAKDKDDPIPAINQELHVERGMLKKDICQSLCSAPWSESVPFLVKAIW